MHDGRSVEILFDTLRMNRSGTGWCAALRVTMAYGGWVARAGRRLPGNRMGLGIVDASPHPPYPRPMTSFTASHGFTASAADGSSLRAVAPDGPRHARAFS